MSPLPRDVVPGASSTDPVAPIARALASSFFHSIVIIIQLCSSDLETGLQLKDSMQKMP